ncbi:uncharacterized protein DS421_16g532060 [Arachis hypogaea]|nr:uncharacterized protein DS421_16g532060 [Arachis hypogaea]
MIYMLLFSWFLEDRNYLEKLTLAVLSHLPTAVLYVHDLSGECGTSPSDQFSIYKEIKERFSGHLWLDVVSKFDLLKPSPVVYATEKPSPTEFELEKYRKSGPDGAIHVSVKTQQGLNEMAKIKHTMEQPREVKGTIYAAPPYSKTSKSFITGSSKQLSTTELI